MILQVELVLPDRLPMKAVTDLLGVGGLAKRFQEIA
jgi:hypothetical protein